MKHLGIKQSWNVEGIPTFNSEPVLQNKMKFISISGGTTMLTLWGMVNVIKMVVAPKFNYILMILTLTVSPQIFIFS